MPSYYHPSASQEKYFHPSIFTPHPTSAWVIPPTQLDLTYFTHTSSPFQRMRSVQMPLRIVTCQQGIKCNMAPLENTMCKHLSG